MESKKAAGKSAGRLPPVSNCDECLYYDYDGDSDELVCQIDMDQDELASYMSGRTASCPYYRYYNEYKSVQKQN